MAIILTYLLAYLGVSLVQEGSFMRLEGEVYTVGFQWIIDPLTGFPLIPLAEKIFGFTTSISLVELSDMNKPLLRNDIKDSRHVATLHAGRQSSAKLRHGCRGQ
ncbi:MAG: hypothetical protein R2788_03720 [Saprospiraceae bacterium]